ncbi:HAD family hydrolase [Specibacter sp. AOP5-B1-6]|uniref:HAD family hydrolase n=1 Tax=Specibacter sp. AOP5-B1-6 TaxID=3457653 RepID=UPI00402BBB7C
MAAQFTRAVLFDMDGTLIDSSYFHAMAWWQALRQSGFTVPTAKVHRAVGMGGEELVHHLLGPGVSKDQLGTLLGAHDAIFSTHWPALLPFPAAGRLLEHCAAAGAAVVLASSAKEAELDVLRHALDAGSAISAATSSSDADHGTPSPDILSAALNSVGVDAAHALFIGDAVWDAKAAQALGLPMIGVCSGGTSEADLRGAGAVEVHSDVQELLEHVDASVLGQLLQR